jgi:hypothetical protein
LSLSPEEAMRLVVQRFSKTSERPRMAVIA